MSEQSEILQFQVNGITYDLDINASATIAECEAATSAANTAAAHAEITASKSPYIDETTGTWWVWDSTASSGAGAYVDTNVSADPETAKADKVDVDNANSVIAEAMLYLYNENKALRELLTGKNKAVLPYIKAQTIECVDKMTMGVPDILESSVAGAPSTANVPDNWNEETMTVWDGCPRRIGQQYVDKESGKVYYAIKVTGSTSDWVALN